MTAQAEAILAGDVSYMRQADWFDPAHHEAAHVTIVGVGGIGSPTALALAKLGIPRLTLIDPDIVERHNLPNQMFPMWAATGSPKVDAMRGLLEDMTPVELDSIEAKLTDIQQYSGIVVGALDSMEARAQLWDKVKLKLHVPLYIDGRLGGENIVVYAINPSDPDDIEYYERTLYTDEEARQDSCTRQSIIDVGFVVSALITRAVRRHYTGAGLERMVFLDQANLVIGKE